MAVPPLQAGVLRGQRLYEISDPIRADEMWVLNDRPSLRFVRDAFSMRRSPTIDLVLSRMPEAEPVSPPSSLTASSGSEEPEPGACLGGRLRPIRMSDLMMLQSGLACCCTVCSLIPRLGRMGLHPHLRTGSTTVL